MLRIYGVHVAEEDGRYLAVMLLTSGDPDAVAASERISVGVARGNYHAVPLSVDERAAVLSVMAVPPPGLEELHRKLVIDQSDRSSFAA